MPDKKQQKGGWCSAISAEQVAKQSVRFGHSQVFDGRCYWLETRPYEKGRTVLVCFDGFSLIDLTPDAFSVRSKVHEMGGADFLVTHSGIFFVNASDQNIYCQHGSGVRQLTHHQGEVRFADFCIDASGANLFAVAEYHRSSQPVENCLVAINTENGEYSVIQRGADFYASPRLSPDQSRLCWLQWNFPQMPWDGTELWLAEIADGTSLQSPRKIIGGAEESIFQPEWCDNNRLFFVSDRSGFWNLYSHDGEILEAHLPTDHDCGLPAWVLGLKTYVFADQDTIYLSAFEQGIQCLLKLSLSTAQVQKMDLPFTEYPGQLAWCNGQLLTLAGSPSSLCDYWLIEPDMGQFHSPRSSSTSAEMAHLSISLAENLLFPSPSGYSVQAFFYPPCNSEYALSAELPPLIVMSHGGPSGHTSNTLNWGIQFWTSRGFAVVDVNYGGSTGFGREYRQLLNQQWGVRDVADCVAAARFLVAEKRVNPNQLLIRGGSAGGFTTLCALAFYEDFAAGMSRYGVADLTGLLKDTHKFEARYLEQLIGNWPEAKEVYQQRSPIHHADKLTCPILALQGDQDNVVPKEQAEALVAALAEKSIPHAYLLFAGEGHGFRQQQTLIDSLHAELSFYRQVLAIESEELIPKLSITGLN